MNYTLCIGIGVAVAAFNVDIALFLWHNSGFGTADRDEGIRAFQEKRQARFQGC